MLTPQECQQIAKFILEDDGFRKEVKNATVNYVRHTNFAKEIGEALNKAKGEIREKFEHEYDGQIEGLQRDLRQRIKNYVSQKEVEFERRIVSLMNIDEWVMKELKREITERVLNKVRDSQITVSVGSILDHLHEE